MAPDPFIDHVFDGRYRIVQKLGTGGMANVYLAEDGELGRRVALKMLDDRHAQDEQFVERFRREAKNSAGLSHPNIVAIYDRGEAEGTYYIAMEYLEGRTLKQLLIAHGPTPIPIALEYTRQVLAGLGFAHRNGIVHRDIKPHNIVVGPDGRLKVTDFGIARSGSSQMTEAGSIIGTAQYLSPEQARGAPVDQRSDLYSVGVVLYEMLTGKVPFTGDTPLEIAMKHLSTTPEPPSAQRPDVPQALDQVVLRALAKHPDDRYQSAQEMDADLARITKGSGVSRETEEAATAILSGTALAAAAPTEVIPRARRATTGAPGARPPARTYDYADPRRRRPLWPWLLALLLVVGAGFAAFYVYTKIQDQLNATKPATVPFVVGDKEVLAVGQIRDAGLKPHVRRIPHQQTQVGYVYDQDPTEGTKTDKGNVVTILVSTGRPKSVVPNVIGKQAPDATAALASVKLKPKLVEIHSDKPSGEVTGQFPKPGSKVVQGTVVRINVSKGIAPVDVPSVIGEPFEQASSEVQAAGFAVARNDVTSKEPKDTVVGESPSAGTLQPKGSTITLSVSKGPQTNEVPDVTSTDPDTAVATLKASNFKVHVQSADTTDPAQDGIVLSQSPDGHAQAKPGTTVTIVVGRFKEEKPPPPPPPPPPPDTTPTTPTDTVTTPTATTPPPPPPP